MFTRAGSYCLAVAVVDPVSSETVQIPPHSASTCLVILPGAAVAERTLVSDLPERLTAGKLSHSTYAACTSVNASACTAYFSSMAILSAV